MLRLLSAMYSELCAGGRRLRGRVGDGEGNEERAFRSGLRDGILRVDLGMVMGWCRVGV